MAKHSRPSRPFHSLEPLEARIAPALLTRGANLLGGSNPLTGESSAGGNAVTLIKVLSGQAIAWYDGTHITEISFAPGTTLDLTGNITGDIVGNLTSAGRLADSDHNPANGEDGNLLLANSLLGLTTHQLGAERGDVGHILTGGTVAGINVNGRLSGVYAGDGVFQTGSAMLSGGAVHSDTGLVVNPIDSSNATGFTFQRVTSSLVAGASINKLTVAIAQDLQVFAGSGAPQGVTSTGAGVAGGSIANVHIVSALISAGASGSTASYALVAGAGGAGRLSGGAGGTVFNVLEDTSTSQVQIVGGAGGDSTTGAGGAGGGIHDLDLQGDSASYTVTAGKGGAGKPGGIGGSVVHTNFAGRKPNSGIIVTADFNGDGQEDVLVVDANTGDMVISSAENTGTTFVQQVQYHDQAANKDITRITGAGTTPSDAVAVDVDRDGDLDIVVAYKNSNKVTVFTNNGDGSFYDGANHKFRATDVSLTYSPDHLTAGNFSGSAAPDLVVTETTGGISSAHLLVGDDQGAFTTNSSVLRFASQINDLITAKTATGDVAFAGAAGGQLYALVSSGNVTDPLSLVDPKITLAGGVATLDANSTGDTLVAVSSTGRLVDFYNIGNGGSLTSFGNLDLTSISGRVLSAHFVVTGTGTQGDSLGVLSTAGGGSQFGLYSPSLGSSTASFTQARQVVTTTALKNFAVAYDYTPNGNVASFGFAALGGSLNQFSYSVEVGNPTAYSIPFSGKKVGLTSGDGGAGVGAFAGGAAGAINGLNIESTDVSIVGGLGGSSDSGPGGAGGSISNPVSFVTLSAQNLQPVIASEQNLSITGGAGGTSTLTAPTAAGGAGGSIAGVNLSLASGTITLLGGAGGLGHGGAGGAGGNLSTLGLTSFDGSASLAGGAGGEALSGNVRGGLGGSISTISYKLSLLPVVEAQESSYAVALLSGVGGRAAQGLGGAGGGISGITLNLDPADTTAKHQDSTVRVSVTTGAGGDGLNGGAGGTLGKFTSVTLFDQVDQQTVTINPVVLHLTGGVGGQGTGGTGGTGGSILLTGSAPIQGITHYDAEAAEYGQNPLIVTAGAGGAGSLRGGAGGSVAGLVVQNAIGPNNTFISDTQLGGAVVTAGAGGTAGTADGGAGGSISGLQLAPKFSVIKVEPNAPNPPAVYTTPGNLSVTAGAGGAGTRGGAGGSVTSSYLADVNADIVIAAGFGGDGVTAGGRGGALSGLNVNSPEIALHKSFTLTAGAGGAASANAGAGGIGGSIGTITQTKDINSVIGLIQAGSGGAALRGTGGAGGAVSGVTTVGFLGNPVAHGAFDLNGNPQGVFAGRGGLGSVASGLAGSIANIVARQIAALGAAYDASTHTFGVASAATAIRADVIGYDVDHDGVFDYAGTPSANPSPSRDQPIDGFILAKAISAINGLAPFQFKS